MAVRYTGNIEIHMTYEKGRYRVRFKALMNGVAGKGTLTPRECQLSQKDDLTSPEAYDKVAERVVGFLKLKGVKTGELRRVFQAPCPIPVRSRHG